ncbi:hypothetical protein AUEXF2481DRAFT_42959 [Aureobasidium subglaciale EXF-2481]|uniref:Ecp2 effector protein domain-containing protein n=1 Tax=Aureobasidium subglaciale (strain EXF-2481) TaxID=1043005 RepID=A0A074Y468_AURSE|nr:uncharacterized protein AUEXF2481DRAFT_42959 [Aureobasidium subglaciale EXF-2481]KAI5210809.1 hypothetical protein E4T38_01768 [Aureobasidium subglaciale]KAI5229412.1 hypothetical protein E4T40_01712 [Aureobasidium subglaciale]KAI5232949.1 hypothetical protein E4T41_01766 [Aureobasidium subglaciale]KAI5266302.1 hypothetical protein E4T46_01709 [Aureobasidium subglaciale]KEQ92510.1 hypothetical protein AUEXF2481DRAFT_42959 [Aureobasidium subglaciale EXF-2481]
MHSTSIIAFLAISLAPTVSAFAGASVFACLNYANPISKSFNASFVVGGGSTYCMNNVGHDANMTVSQSGLTCASIGYVESNAGWGCLTEDSIWGLAYSALSKTGSTSSHWWWSTSDYNNVELKKQSRGTVVCDNKAVCSDTKINWPDQGPIYFIFFPEQSTTVMQSERPEGAVMIGQDLDKELQQQL